MRSIQIFIVRIVQDENEPDILRGEVRSVASGEAHAFTNEQGMLSLLHKMRGGPIHRDIAADILETPITNQTKED